MYQDPHQTKAQFDAEVAAYAFMDDTAAVMTPAPKPAGDLDVFTSAELEQQGDLYYANGARLYAAAVGYAGHTGQAGRAGHLLMSAAMEQFELQGAVCLELARRFAETTAREIPGSMGTGNVNDDDEESLQFADESEWMDDDADV